MGDGLTNRHLHRARERLEGLPKRAIEQGWETSDALLCEIELVKAQAMIAQAEIQQEILHNLQRQEDRSRGTFPISPQGVMKMPYREMQRYAEQLAKEVAERLIREEVEKRVGKKKGWFEGWFGG